MSATFTPTEQRILALLADGNAHSKIELDRCLNDDMAGANTLNTHLTNIRRKLSPIGQTVYCNRQNGCVLYSHVRLVAR